MSNDINETRSVCKLSLALDVFLTLLIVFLCIAGINYIYEKHEEKISNYHLNNKQFFSTIDDSRIYNFSCIQLELSKGIVKEVNQKLINV